MKTEKEIKRRIELLQRFVDNPSEKVEEIKYHRQLEIQQLKWVLEDSQLNLENMTGVNQ